MIYEVKCRINNRKWMTAYKGSDKKTAYSDYEKISKKLKQGAVRLFGGGRLLLACMK